MNNTPRVENYLQNFNSQFVPAELARNFERELTEKTNEVARLRGLLNRAIEIAEDFQSNGHDTACYYEVNKFRCRCGFIDASDELDKIKTELARLAPSPEEPANPTCSNTTHKFSHCDCKQPSEKDTSTETCPSQKDTQS